MIYRWDDLCESQDFDHDQKFVKAEHWREACDELEDKTKTLKQTQGELSQARKLIAELVKMGEFYASEENWLFNQIAISKDCEDIVRPNKPVNPSGGKLARSVLSNNKKLIEKLTKE